MTGAHQSHSELIVFNLSFVRAEPWLDGGWGDWDPLLQTTPQSVGDSTMLTDQVSVSVSVSICICLSVQMNWSIYEYRMTMEISTYSIDSSR